MGPASETKILKTMLPALQGRGPRDLALG